jgi:branched-chain amino acid transport system substrate-binding protein
MVGSWTLSMANYIDNAGPGGEGARMPQTFIRDRPRPSVQSFIINRKTFNRRTSASPAVSAAQGYDSIYLLLPPSAGQFHRRPKDQGRPGRPEST